VLMAQTLGKHSQVSEWGAELYVAGRVLYLPLYAVGIPVVRTIVWTAATIGIVMIMLAIYPGM
jgi:uncharacterized MAPEG superfamily protein